MSKYNVGRRAAVSLIREDSWGIYADGFKRAAQLLISSVQSTYEINTVVFPILFLCRHHIELMLKEIIGYGLYLNEEVRPPPGGHDLQNLWKEAKAYIRKEISDVSTDESENIEHLILEIHALDATSEGSRYPVIKKRTQGGRNASFSWDSPHINLDELDVKMKTIGEFLHKVANFLSVAQDLEAEFRADYYSYGYYYRWRKSNHRLETDALSAAQPFDILRPDI